MEIRKIASEGANCYILKSGSETFVVDPGCPCDKILGFCNGIRGILLTHGHYDHILYLDELRNATGAPAYIHEADAEMLKDGRKSLYKYVFGKDRVFGDPDFTLGDSEVLVIGDEKLRVVHTPGHSKGSVCFLGDGFMLTGDTLFADTFGRVDCYGGNLAQMRSSLLKLSEFDASLMIYPGHGENSSLGEALSKIRFVKRHMKEGKDQ